MKLEIRRDSLHIIPEKEGSVRELDITYIEEVLGLKTEGDIALVRRHDTMGFSLSYLEVKKIKPNDVIPKEK
jgi:hypothetical protein